MTTHYGTSGVAHHPTHDIVDSSSLNDYSTCARKSFFTKVLGWKPDRANIHLTFGTAVHLAKEQLRWLHHRDGCYKPEHIEPCMELFEAEYRKHWSIEDDADNAPKNTDCFRWAMEEYLPTYGTDRYEVLHTELPGSVPIDASGDFWVNFKLDAVVRDHLEGGKIVIYDDKTTSAAYMNNPNWARHWQLSIQFFIYNHVGMCLWGDDFWGVKVDGIGLSKKPRVKKDGGLYASDVDKAPQFRRVPVRFAAGALEKAYQTVYSRYMRYKSEFDVLRRDSPDAVWMAAFEENWSGCGSYGGCPYFDFCAVRSNPLAHSLEPPIGFRREFWNPAEKQENAKEVIKWDASERRMHVEQLDKPEAVSV